MDEKTRLGSTGSAGGSRRSSSSPADQRTVLKLVDALAEVRQRSRPARSRAAS